jgi:D-alanine-D-alanine ligase
MQSKTRTREILSGAGYLQPKYMTLAKHEITGEHLEVILASIRTQVAEKVVVKPDTLGSSIGISLAGNDEELKQALDLAFKLDKRVIVEEYLENIREINCSALRYNGKVKVSRCELIKNGKAIFDYDTKYMDPDSGFVKKGKNGRGRIKQIEEDVEREIQRLTVDAYELFGARGVVRADFMVVGSKVYLNEINTIPGFLSYHLWLRTGVPYGVLIDMLIKQAAIEKDDKTVTVFTSQIFEKNRSLIEN